MPKLLLFIISFVYNHRRISNYNVQIGEARKFLICYSNMIPVLRIFFSQPVMVTVFSRHSGDR